MSRSLSILNEEITWASLFLINEVTFQETQHIHKSWSQTSTRFCHKISYQRKIALALSWRRRNATQCTEKLVEHWTFQTILLVRSEAFQDSWGFCTWRSIATCAPPSVLDFKLQFFLKAQLFSFVFLFFASIFNRCLDPEKFLQKLCPESLNAGFRLNFEWIRSSCYFAKWLTVKQIHCQASQLNISSLINFVDQILVKFLAERILKLRCSLNEAFCDDFSFNNIYRSFRQRFRGNKSWL